MTAIRISLPAPADYIAHVLLGAARGSNGPVEVWASSDGAELVAETVEVEPPKSEAPDDHCVCGHVRSQHIYWEGACRPGWFCRCAMFVEVEQAPAPSAAGTGKDEGPVPATIAPHPGVVPSDAASAPALPVESPSTAAPGITASTAPIPGFPAEGAAGAGESAADPATAAAPEPEPAAGSGAPTIRRCAECGAEFIPNPRERYPRRFCEDRCKWAHNNRKSRARRMGEPVVPAREKPEKPVVPPAPDTEPEQMQSAAGPKPNPLTGTREDHPCPHCPGVSFPTKKTLGKHTAAIHPIRSGRPAYEPLAEPVHVVQPHTRRATA